MAVLQTSNGGYGLLAKLRRRMDQLNLRTAGRWLRFNWLI
jgi:hypothetical protein